MTIQIRNNIVQVNPAVLSAGGSAVDLNGLLLTNAVDVPIGSVSTFGNAADVGSYFGLASAEYGAAQIYFAGPLNATKTPGALLFAQYPSAPVAAYLRGGNVSALTLTQLQAIAGTLTITSDGVANTAATLNLATATSFSDAATKIQAAFTTPTFTVTYNAQHGAFEFISGTTGATSTMIDATGTAAASLMLTAATGAVLSQGAIAGVPGTAMNAIVAVTQNWGTFSTMFEPALADKEAFSAWTSLQNERYLYAGYDSDVNAKTSGSTATWVYAIKAANDVGTAPIFGDVTHAAFLMGQVASLDFTRLNGRATSAFKQGTGLVASVTSDADATALLANGYNFYGAFGTGTQNFTWFHPGSMAGKWKWVDSYVNQIWLNAQLQSAMLNLLLSVGSIPYNSDGYAMVDAAIMDPLNAALNFGAIRAGVPLSSSQASQLQNALGVDVSNVIYQRGYYLQIQPASAATRAARSSPPMTLYYMDGGSIQQLVLASIEVQ